MCRKRTQKSLSVVEISMQILSSIVYVYSTEYVYITETRKRVFIFSVNCSFLDGLNTYIFAIQTFDNYHSCNSEYISLSLSRQLRYCSCTVEFQ